VVERERSGVGVKTRTKVVVEREALPREKTSLLDETGESSWSCLPLRRSGYLNILFSSHLQHTSQDRAKVMHHIENS
jgi:hypothetical protein